eukprot:TRINITY_DN437_c0_g1_i3.p1 TRINITY_DN437_c0_g1~~TRINITY_DN437_c0_g1_i3.p1  ORF type:complete len:1363 (+),score=232.88 TRINITY_DN437_c0_g1_i3:2601-6689(+)
MGGARDPNSLTITTLNVGSLSNKVDEVLAMESDISCLQEVKLTAHGQHMIGRHVEDNGRYRALWGNPQPGIVVDGLAAPDKAQRGGVGILVQRCRPAIVKAVASMDDGNRWVHAMINLDGRDMWLHLIVVYCHSGSYGKHQRETLLNKVLNEMRCALGDVPIIVAGDLNTEVSQSGVLQQAVGCDWVDAAAMQAEKDGVRPSHTFVRRATDTKTRIDYVLMNPIAAAGLQKAWVHDTVYTNEHRCLSIKLCIPTLKSKTRKYFIPKELPVSTASDDHVIELLQAERFIQKLEDIDGAYRVLADVSERHCITGVPMEQQKTFRGRGEERKPKEKCLSAKSVKEATGAAVGRQKSIACLQRKLAHISAEIQVMIDKGQVCNMPVVLLKTWANALSLLEKLPNPPVFDRNLLKDDLESIVTRLQLLDDNLSSLLREIAKDTRVEREKKYEARINTQFQEERRGMTAFVKNTSTSAAQAVESGGVLTADLDEMDRMMHAEWDGVLQMYGEGHEEPSYEAFKARYGPYISTHDMVLQPLTGADLRAVLAKKSTRTAPGVDGWRMAELRAMPNVLLDAWAMLFNAIEVTGKWPKALLTALVTLIPKGGERTPLNHRPITVTSAVYRLWACARLRDISPWQEKWADDSQHGFRPRHGTDSILMELSTQLETAMLTNTPLNGIALDFVKCFDRVPQKVAFGLMQDLGLHQRILTPLKAMYAGLKRRFRFPTGVGSEFHVTNGILQGCPISVILVNALVSVMVKCVIAEVPGSRSLSYADDAYLLARLVEVLKRATNKTIEFCERTGMRLNENKSQAFSTKDEIGPWLKCTGSSFRVTKGIKALGVILNMNGKHSLDKLHSAEGRLSRLGALPLSFGNKASMLTGTVLPSCLYGTTYAAPSDNQLKKLCTATVTSLWGPRFRMRSPMAVLNVLLPGHTAYPQAKIVYNTVNCLVRESLTSPQLWQRVNEIVTLYREREDDEERGPLGVLLKRWLPFLNKGWSFIEGLRALVPSARRHEVRQAIRPAVAKELIHGRSSFAGMEAGACPSTNAWWRKLQSRRPLISYRLRRIISGAVFTVHPRVWGKQLDEREGVESSSLACDVCDHRCQTTTEVTEHALWECAPARAALTNERYGGMTRSDLPAVTALHGIIPRGATGAAKQQAAVVQRYLLDVVSRRDARAAERSTRILTTNPWDEITTGKQHTVPTVELLKSNGASGKVLMFYMKSVLRWLKSLRWYAGRKLTSVTTMELAVDYEQATRQSLAGPLDDQDWLTEKAGRMRYILGRIQKCTAKSGKNAFPANAKTRVHTLRQLGGPTAHGYDRRPLFSSSQTAPYLARLQAMFLAQMPSISSRQTATAGTRQQPQNGDRLV